MSSGYQGKGTDRGLVYDTYKDDGVALFRVQGTGSHSTKAVQVDLVCIFFLIFSSCKGLIPFVFHKTCHAIRHSLIVDFTIHPHSFAGSRPTMIAR